MAPTKESPRFQWFACVAAEPNEDDPNPGDIDRDTGYAESLAEAITACKQRMDQFVVELDVTGQKWYQISGHVNDSVIRATYHLDPRDPDDQDLSSTTEKPPAPGVEEFVTAPPCPTCEGRGIHMGTLGNRKWYRCRECGLNFNTNPGDSNATS